MTISKDTNVCISIAAQPGKSGSIFHNAGYAYLGLDWIYLPRQLVDCSSLPDLFCGIKSLGIKGCSVSMPFKEKVIAFLDELDATARKVGAVNTIKVRENSSMIGYNTDYIGVLRVLEKFNIYGKRAVVLGAGGVARAVASAILKLRGNVSIVNRTRLKGELLSDSIGCTYEELTEINNKHGYLLVNCTPLGMQDGDSGSGIMVYVIIILVIICFMILAFFASSNKKPNPVYLKPKEKDEKGGKDKKNSDKKESEDNVSEKSVAAPPPPRPDEDAMRSDIRALRQTAVSLTVGEKEGASTLIKEWLDDNPNKKDEGGDGSEETEGE